MLYNDDWTAVNPLGMYSRKHKISGFYFTIGNLPREYRSCQQGIWLVALCHSKAIKKLGMNSVIEPIITNLKSLQTEGIIVNGRKYFGNLRCFCADNLAGILNI